MSVEEYASHLMVLKVTAGLMTDNNKPKSGMVMLIKRVDSHYVQCVCFYVYMYVCMYARMYVCMNVCMHECMYVCMYV